jgi:hypothetical protein
MTLGLSLAERRQIPVVSWNATKNYFSYIEHCTYFLSPIRSSSAATIRKDNVFGCSERKNYVPPSRSYRRTSLIPERFRGRGTAWAIICIALCAVTGFTFAYFYTAHFEWQASSVWALVSASILRAVGLCAVMVPALFRRTGFRLERRRTFVFLCLLSLISVVAAWVLWHFRSPKWPQVLLTVSDVFSAIAGAQLVISSAYELTAMPYDSIDMDARWAELEAQNTH